MNENLERIRRYNLWDGQHIPSGFPRTIYTDKIKKYIGNRLVKVLTGQRRAGKSYIMRQLADNMLARGVMPENILMINMEFEAFGFIDSHIELDNLIRSYEDEFRPQGRVYIFIDEVQEIEGWEQAVNSYSQDYTREYEIFVTGSNSKMLSSEMATLLSGRYVEFKVFTLSFNEYCAALGLEANRQNYIEYMQTGGLPELLNLHGEETRQNYISALKDTVLLKDIILRNKIKDVQLLEDVFVYLVNNASNLVSITNMVNWFKSRGRKTSYDTVAAYAGHIGDAYLIHKAERYNIRGKDVVSGNCKFYVNDLAFKNYLYKGFGYGAGYLLENLVYLELRRSGYDVYVGNIKDKEVDFVAMKGGNVIYVQAVYMLIDQQTVEREYSALWNINDNWRKVVVSLDDVCRGVSDGIEHILAWNFPEWLSRQE